MPANPFALLSLVGAPAVLTNAASVLALSTSNRFLRASERMRAFAAAFENLSASPDTRALLLKQMDRTEEQAALLLGALRGAYMAAGVLACKRLLAATRSSMLNMSEEAAYVRQHHQPLSPGP